MTILVAEIGWNFLGNIDLAKKMIVSAKKSGADAVKFQIWNPTNYINDMNLIEKNLSENNLEEELYSLLDNVKNQN